MVPGRVTVVNYWSSWNPDCYKHINMSNQLIKAYDEAWIQANLVQVVNLSSESDH
jgi:hypothetical protein